MNFKVSAPGKLILSGEHAVVYEQPALAIAMPNSMLVELTPINNKEFTFDCPTLNYKQSYTLSELEQQQQTILEHHLEFLEKRRSINKVLDNPLHLLPFVVAQTFEYLAYKPQQGFTITLTSDIPLGCGMGSSAAAILITIKAVLTFAKKELSDMALWQLAKNCEDMQHGRSSGLDLYISLHGGCRYWQKDKQPEKRSFSSLPFYLVNTGKPTSSTGECVTHAKKNLTPALASEIARTTNLLDQALQTNDLSKAQAAIDANHQLLTQIDIVPFKIQNFVNDIKKQGGVAKICGAGSVRGENGGILLILAQDNLDSLCEIYGYQAQPLQGNPNGLQLL